MLKNGLPYFHQSINTVLSVLEIKQKLLDKYNDVSFRLGSTYAKFPFEMADVSKIKKVLNLCQSDTEELKSEIKNCQFKLDKLQDVKSPKQKIIDFFTAVPEIEEIFNKDVENLEDRIEYLNKYVKKYDELTSRLSLFLDELENYKSNYEKDLIHFKDKLKTYEMICEPKSRFRGYNHYLGMNYSNLSVESFELMVQKYDAVLDERIEQVYLKLMNLNQRKEFNREDILQCLADETLENIYNKTLDGDYYVDLDALKEDTMNRFGIELMEDDVEKIYDIICGDYYVLDSECEWYEDSEGKEQMCIMVGYDRVNDGYNFDDDYAEERYELRQTAFEELCQKKPLDYNKEENVLTLPDGTQKENILSEMQAQKWYEDCIYREVDSDPEVEKMIDELNEYNGIEL